ncbi:tRNA (adenine(22)-N(1))-methyltransferase [Stieleria varia]|uniref:tRNA (Adenine(22)-N(1))-methyltransferase n=1 Tax=Stieleria varia TaxID=2528005 RepID=A0A5C6A370_9BACT|nr:class I SAM-dependent methyltransferase [Stieleria varia]TWT93820.1 tRNA (adenine(22)-N(1))-methyltransferase [Stieleria varia]
MPKLDKRLKTVARLIRSQTHADIGSDHGHLLAALLAAGRVERGIAIENKRQPFLNSTATLAGKNAEVRFGDGLAALSKGEVQSLSICGMGGESIVRILNENPDRVPSSLVLQPNHKADQVRRWAWQSGYHLRDEQFAPGHWQYVVLAYSKATPPESEAPDPAYVNLDLEAAFLFGPTAIRNPSKSFLERLQEEREYLTQMKCHTPVTDQRLRAIDRLMVHSTV